MPNPYREPDERPARPTVNAGGRREPDEDDFGSAIRQIRPDEAYVEHIFPEKENARFVATAVYLALVLVVGLIFLTKTLWPRSSTNWDRAHEQASNHVESER